jgi:hypothetical protein
MNPNPYPMDPDYWGAEAIPFVPVFADEPLSPDASQEPTQQTACPPQEPVPGDAGNQEESHHE